MLRRLYEWILALAARPLGPLRARRGLLRRELVLPDPARRDAGADGGDPPEKAWTYALIATLSSVAGGIAGYAIGALLYDSLGAWLFHLYGLDKGADAFREAYAHYGHWVILLKGLTPIPYKLVTITSGFAGYDLFWFIVLSLITRACGSSSWPGSSAVTGSASARPSTGT